jgi:hypothetical protein
MKKSILYGLSFLALMLAGYSCTQDFLELEPKTGLTEANYYKNEEQALLAVTAVYDAYSVQNWQFAPVMSDIWSDDAFCGGSDATDMAQWQDMEMFKMEPENNSSSDLWSRCYAGIYRANLYLQKQEGVEWVTDGLKARFEGEVKFLRAYFYWDLVRHYGWVPPKYCPMLRTTRAFRRVLLTRSFLSLPETCSLLLPLFPRTLPLQKQDVFQKQLSRPSWQGFIFTIPV